ncbi:hypothetical protein TNCT_138221 [Trichonephila clavata]|uniref:Uncharacterized protein n=1 Tax=Trichonephila clavata TaxID=2740835 RepID=A0A8X6J217_TRICU|nr:hypothetical protein TNCT_138221 [Trichonephila clavata]
MRHLQSKQLRTPENPVCVEEHHQFACEARCRWSCSELALRFVDYAIYLSPVLSTTPKTDSSRITSSYIIFGIEL